MAHSRRTIVSMLVILVAMLVATSPAATAATGTWGPRVTIAHGTGAQPSSAVLEDAAFRGKRVAVGWSTPLSGLATPSGCAAAVTVGALRRDDPGADPCPPGVVRVVLRRHPRVGVRPLPRWPRCLRARPVGDAGGTRSITTGATTPRWPDIVCPGPSQVAWVAWVANDQAYLARATTTDPGLPVTVVVGTADSMQYGPVLVPSGEGVLVAWAAPSGDILGRHATAAGGITLGSPFVIGDGSLTHRASFPRIGSSGSRIVVAWERCDVRTRVSQDGGATWGPNRRVTDLGCDVADVYVMPRSVGVRGTRIAVAYAIGGLGGGEERLVQSTDDLAHRTNRRLARELDDIAIGYTEVSGKTRLAVAYDSGTYIRFRRCSAAICGGF